MKVDRRFADLYEAEFANVFRAVLLLCGDRATAEDATQEAFARALERWRRLRDRQWAAGWVMTTAMNAARRSLKRRPEPVRAPSADHDLDAEVDLWRSVRRLPRRQQEAVVLHYVLDLPIAEVGQAMGCEEGTVKAHLSRARDAMRAQLEDASEH